MFPFSGDLPALCSRKTSNFYRPIVSLVEKAPPFGQLRHEIVAVLVMLIRRRRISVSGRPQPSVVQGRRATLSGLLLDCIPVSYGLSMHCSMAELHYKRSVYGST